VRIGDDRYELYHANAFAARAPVVATHTKKWQETGRECERVHIGFCDRMFPSTLEITWGKCTMKCDYDGFKIESFEIGKGLWHARIRRADLLPVVIDGVLFSSLEVGFAWSDPDAAIADAKGRIDHFNLKQYVTAAPMPETELPIAS
jgi:hypothetical protein